MTAAAALVAATPETSRAIAAAPDPTGYVQTHPDGCELNLIVDNIVCAACVPRIEDALAALPHIGSARVNLTLGRLRVRWTDPRFVPGAVLTTIESLGYRGVPYNPDLLPEGADEKGRALLRAMAVAGFAASNIMLLSVSIWSGHDMGPGTRGLFHGISALIALPAVAYAGQPFFLSAWHALRTRSVNMDVPISLGVLLACGASVMETLLSGPHAYFDAATMLLFFLLLGRYLDQRMRARATGVAANLLALKAIAATVIEADGRRTLCPATQLKPGMRVAVAPGDRIPADGIILTGRSDIDPSLVTGESLPAAVGPGDVVYAGTLSLSGSLEIQVSRGDRDSLLSQIVALMENAGQSRARITRIADRAARKYAPTVHVLAASTFLGWMAFGAGGWHPALMAAIAVLIITCPCAIGLAVPAVQAVATGRLLRAGVLIKSPDALERLAEVDTVIFDKTGTLTRGQPELVPLGETDNAALTLARGMATGSRHPLCAALVRTAGQPVAAIHVEEHPGLGLRAIVDGVEVRLGSRLWCDVTAPPGAPGESELWLARAGKAPCRFGFRDQLRTDAAGTIAALKARGLMVEILSGDRPESVHLVARTLGVLSASASVQPQDKVARLKTLAAAGHKVLMVGDGLNDAPALALAHVSISPAGAADISQAAADLLFRGERLAGVLEAIQVAHSARRRVLENFVMAIGYNMIAVPVAMAGLLTPLIAALAMSGSSIVVVLNALRVARTRKAKP